MFMAIFKDILLTGIFKLFKKSKLRLKPQAISLNDVVNVSMENNKIRSISFNNINTEKLKLLDNIIINAKINAYINHKLRAFFK